MNSLILKIRYWYCVFCYRLLTYRQRLWAFATTDSIAREYMGALGALIGDECRRGIRVEAELKGLGHYYVRIWANTEGKSYLELSTGRFGPNTKDNMLETIKLMRSWLVNPPTTRLMWKLPGLWAGQDTNDLGYIVLEMERRGITTLCP